MTPPYVEDPTRHLVLKDGAVVPLEHVVARLNELHRLQDAFQCLASRMYPLWRAPENTKDWLVPYLIVNSDPEACRVVDLVARILETEIQLVP